MPDEGWVLDGLNLNGAALQIEEISFPPPKKRTEWAQGGDADGAILVRDPLFENREGTMKVRVAPKATMLLAAQAVAGISRKLEECEATPGGLPLVWTQADGTVPAVTFYVLSGSITDLPMAQTGESGYFVKAPMVTLSLTCRPFAYGTETVLGAVAGSGPFVTVTVPSVPGDVPAEGRLVVTDGSSQMRRYVEWGLEQRDYQPATSLLVDSDDLVTTGFAGTQTTRAGAYDTNATGNNVVRATLQPSPSAVCGLGTLTHVGAFRVKARVFATATGTSLRLAWRDGDGSLGANAYATPAAVGAFAEVDLGVVTIAKAKVGAQQWTGQIEALNSGYGNALEIDHLVLVPVREGYGRARGENIAQVGVVTADDTFNGTSGDLLGARIAPSGGAWTTSGATGDFVLDNAGTVRRQTNVDASPRFAVIGPAVTGSAVRAIFPANFTPLNGTWEQGVLLRFVDASNYLAIRFQRTYANTGSGAASVGVVVFVVEVVAGAATVLWSSPRRAMDTFVLDASVTAAGAWSFRMSNGDAASGQRASLATGGALASGKTGLYDRSDSNPSGIARTVTAFTASTLPTAPPVIHPGRSMEIASDGSAIRENATGSSTYGQVPSYRGSRFVIPPAGDKNRTSRILVKADRNDLETSTDEPLGDSLSVTVRYTPRYLVVGA